MLKRSAFWTTLTVNVLVTLLPSLGHSRALTCHQALLISTQRQRGLEEPKVDWNNDKSFLEANQRKESFGQVSTFFSEKWGTQVYYTKTGMPDLSGNVPLVDPNSSHIYLFFHGSGTMKSSGRNFISNMNTLANLGISAVSIDLPFHAEGLTQERFNNADYFMAWLKNIVLDLKKYGKPIILAGHSFGPDVILELVSRYPFLVNGVTGLSPAGFTKVLADWYDNYTVKMKFGGEVAENEAGGIWAAKMSSQFKWNKHVLPDPTQVNPNLTIRLLSGRWEEYVPAPVGGKNHTPIGENTYDVSVPLQKTFKNATITLEPGIGHYLFDHTDKDGFNVVLRELLLTAGFDPKNTKAMMEEVQNQNKVLHAPGQLAKKYAQEPLFKSWCDLTYGPGKVIRMALQANDALAQKILSEYSLALKARELEIFRRILQAKETSPQFYQRFKNILDNANPNRVDATLFSSYLTMVLNQSPTRN